MEDLFKLSEKLVGLKERKDVLKRDTEKNNEQIKETKLFASIPDEFKDVIIRWFKEHEEYSGMVKEQINAKSLSSWVKERQEEEDMPEEVEARLKIYEETSIGIRSK